MGWPPHRTRDQVPWLICPPWCCRIFAYGWYVRYLEWTAQRVWRFERQDIHHAGWNWTIYVFQSCGGCWGCCQDMSGWYSLFFLWPLFAFVPKVGLFRGQGRWCSVRRSRGSMILMSDVMVYLSFSRSAALRREWTFLGNRPSLGTVVAAFPKCKFLVAEGSGSFAGRPMASW